MIWKLISNNFIYITKGLTWDSILVRDHLNNVGNKSQVKWIAILYYKESGWGFIRKSQLSLLFFCWLGAMCNKVLISETLYHLVWKVVGVSQSSLWLISTSLWETLRWGDPNKSQKSANMRFPHEVPYAVHCFLLELCVIGNRY